MISRVRIRNGVALAFIVGLVVMFSFFQGKLPQDLLSTQTEETIVTTQDQFPTTIIEHSSTKQFNEQGELDYTFKSNEIRQFQKHNQKPHKKDIAELDYPDMTLFQTDSAPWRITSDKGTAFGTGQKMNLRGNVLVWQNNQDAGTSELSTSFLTLKPQQQHAKTNKPVKLSSPGHLTTATGMTANLKNNTIKLLSNVRGIHEPL